MNNNRIINYENIIDPITIESTKKIIEQMENNIYEIKLNNNNKCIGFFCKLISLNNMNVLIINKAIDYFEKVEILINKKYIEIENRIKYMNRE